MKPSLKGQTGVIVMLALFVTLVPISNAWACACCDTYRVHRVASWDVLNVRTGPGARYRIIGGLQPNEGCIALTGERRGKWVRVIANESGQEGWVHSRYLRYFSGN